MPLVPRVQPVKVLVETPVNVINSLSISIVPEVPKPVAEVKTTDVTEELIVPLRVVVATPAVVPPQKPAPQPVP